MSLMNILVAYNGLLGSGAALHGAVKMQQFYGAHLTGLFAHGSSSLKQQIKPWMPRRVQDAILEVADQSHEEVYKTFKDVSAEVPEEKLHWIDNPGPAQDTVTRYARLFDITALGMHEISE